jgi:4-amino-4-deoxy-L-arabinose transferase-like glycosyltransferase
MTGARAARGAGILIAVCVGAGLVRLLAAARLPLSGDEAYHWEWSRHLAGAYYDHPGMTAWLIALSTRLLPAGSELAVRLPALLSLAAAAAIAYGLARDLARWGGGDAGTGARAGTTASLLVFFAPLPAALSVYMSTDPPLLPLWLGAVWALAAALERGRSAAWVACGACLGLAASTKLIALLLPPVMLAFLLLHRGARAWLRRPQPWLALGAAVLAAAPMWVWNATHDWMTFRFNFDIRQRAQPASPWHPLVFVASQAALLTPGFCALAVAACIARAARARLGAAAVVWCTLLPLGFFLLVSVRRKVGAHWAAAPWTVALVVLAAALALGTPWTKRRSVAWAWRSSWALALAALVFAHLFTLLPEQVARLDLVSGQPRTVLRNLFGWPQLGRAVADAAAALRSAPDSAGVFVVSTQYGTAAAVAFYTPGQPRVHLWSAPRAHGRSYAAWDDWAALRGQDAVFVSKRPLASWELPHLTAHFAAVGEVERVAVGAEGAEQNAFFLVRCRRFDGRAPFPAGG